MAAKQALANWSRPRMPKGKGKIVRQIGRWLCDLRPNERRAVRQMLRELAPEFTSARPSTVPAWLHRISKGRIILTSVWRLKMLGVTAVWRKVASLRKLTQQKADPRRIKKRTIQSLPRQKQSETGIRGKVRRRYRIQPTPVPSKINNQLVWGLSYQKPVRSNAQRQRDIRSLNLSHVAQRNREAMEKAREIEKHEAEDRRGMAFRLRHLLANQPF